MELARRTRWIALGLPLSLAVAAALARPAPPGAAAAGAPPLHPCAAGAASATAAASGPAWYRQDPVLDGSGTLVGQRLTVGTSTVRWTVDLPPESFASGPVGGRVLVGDDDGRRSRLRALDAVRGCWSVIGTESAVIRSAVMAPDGALAYEHRVDRATRRDLGVWRRDLAAPAGAAERVLAGLEADPVGGPTFETSLLVADDGRLVVSACGLHGCRTRVGSPAAGAWARVDGLGPAAGVLGPRLIASAMCPGLPCPLLSVDLGGRDERVLGDAVGRAVVAERTGRVVMAGELGLTVIGPEGRAVVVPASGSLAPIAPGSTSDSGIETLRGRVAIAAGGRVDGVSTARFLDPAAMQLSAAEVLP